MAVVQDWGTLVKRYETDSRRRRQIFLIGIPLGVLSTCLGIQGQPAQPSARQ
ncbi:hypothetical protein [Nonomuraea diastatica]|uniref:hypothetical protein n=1 Tax=Nonomuraea diastatica TaxID=1848329 RepID=UPI00140AED27|nr:hypothetical protein [Nonomuraea diastatica]